MPAGTEAMMSSLHDEMLRDPERHLDAVQARWLCAPGGRAGRGLQRMLLGLDRALVRALFRLRSEGAGRLPPSPRVFTPNHTSSLDAHLLVAALPAGERARLRIAARRDRLLRGPLSARLARATGLVVPIDPDASALAVGAAVLRRGLDLVWFPEGRRTRDGALGAFAPGIGLLLEQLPAPVVPVWIEGAREALPAGARWPRFGAPIVVRFGDALDPEGMLAGVGSAEALVARLRERVVALAPSGL